MDAKVAKNGKLGRDDLVPMRLYKFRLSEQKKAGVAQAAAAAQRKQKTGLAKAAETNKKARKRWAKEEEDDGDDEAMFGVCKDAD